MQKKILPPNLVGGRHVLTQSMFTTSSTIYVVERDYYISQPIKLPALSELRVETGSVSGECVCLPASDQISTPAENGYRMLALGAPLGLSDQEVANTKYMLPGSFLKIVGARSFEMHLNARCRIFLPQYGTMPAMGSLRLTSTNEHKIQIDGSTQLALTARDCQFERIFEASGGWTFVNRVPGKVMNILFENCRIAAKTYTHNNGETISSSFLAVTAIVILATNNNNGQSRCRMTMRDSIVDNLGLQGEVLAENVLFVYGENVNNNFETIHCASHSRIVNCIFDGTNSLVGEGLHGDVIDVFNGHDVVISGCTFSNYKSTGQVGCNMITIKSHYVIGNSDKPLPNDSHVIGQQVGVTVTNNYFDLKDFRGPLVEVWNGVRNNTVDQPALNRQITLLENNVLNAPKAVAFVYCKLFADRLTVRGNSGYVKILVYVPPHYKFEDGMEFKPDDNGNLPAPNQWARDLVIEDNSLIGYFKGNNGQWQEDEGLTVLYGWSFKGISLTGNSTNGYLWNGLSRATQKYVTGVVRIQNNETRGLRGLFRNDGKGMASFDKAAAVCFSGNVSRGKPTDRGPASICLDPSDGIVFPGRQFFKIADNAKTGNLVVFNGNEWVVAG